MDNKKGLPEMGDLSMSAVVVTLILLVLTCVIFVLFQRRKTSKRSILLTGLSDSGKTLLFSQLVHGEYVNTQTSMKENVGDFVSDKGILRLIDIPGYERLRGKYFDEYKSGARGIIYIIDSVTVQKDIRDVAEFLYNILSDPVINGIAGVLIVCNKKDLPLARSIAVVKSLLEKELNALRVTKSSQLESVDPKGGKTVTLGKEGKEFAFVNLSTKVEFVQASGLGDGFDIEELRDWLISLC